MEAARRPLRRIGPRRGPDRRTSPARRPRARPRRSRSPRCSATTRTSRGPIGPEPARTLRVGSGGPRRTELAGADRRRGRRRARAARARAATCRRRSSRASCSRASRWARSLLGAGPFADLAGARRAVRPGRALLRAPEAPLPARDGARSGRRRARPRGRVLQRRGRDAGDGRARHVRVVPVVHGRAGGAPAQRRLNIAITMLGIVYIPLLAAFAFALLGFPDGRGSGPRDHRADDRLRHRRVRRRLLLGQPRRSPRTSARRSRGRARSAPPWSSIALAVACGRLDRRPARHGGPRGRSRPRRRDLRAPRRPGRVRRSSGTSGSRT